MASDNKDVLIDITKFAMMSSGLWIRPLKNPFSNKILIVYSIFMRVNYGLFYVSLIAELTRLVTHNYPFQIILSSFGVCVNATKIAMKAVIYLRNNILEMCDDIIEREREIWRENDPNIIRLYLQKVKTGKVFKITLGLSTIFAVYMLNFTGAYGNFQLIKYNKANNASLESHYMYQFWFPANKLEHLNWVFFISFFYSWAGCTYNITTHMVLIALLLYVASHLVLLQHRLRNYIAEDFKEEQMDEAIVTLKGFIEEHQYLIQFAEKINDNCKSIIMMEFILSSFDVASVTMTIIKGSQYSATSKITLDFLCSAQRHIAGLLTNLYGYYPTSFSTKPSIPMKDMLLTNKPKPSELTVLKITDMIWLMIFFCLLVIQIFCLAWSCNEVNVESLAVADAAFESKWHLLNKNGRQLTQILMTRAQRPLTMTIGPFGPMTTQSFLLVMKAAYSYLSIMR